MLFCKYADKFGFVKKNKISNIQLHSTKFILQNTKNMKPLILLSFLTISINFCPCLSKEIMPPEIFAKNQGKILLMFTRGDETDSKYKLYDYSKMTDLVAMRKDFTREFVDFVHSKNTRVSMVIGDSDVDKYKLVNAKYRHEIVAGIVGEVIERGIDGINIDCEKPLYGDSFKQGFVQFVEDLNFSGFCLVFWVRLKIEFGFSN